MARPASNKPTEGEVQILRLLWANDGMTVKDIAAGIGANSNHTPAYSSVQTRLLLMVDKGLVRRDENVRPARHYALVNENKTQKHVFRELMDRFFRGSAADLVMHALRSEKLSAEERTAIGERLKELKTK